MSDVGDGLCMGIATSNHEFIQIDWGGSNSMSAIGGGIWLLQLMKRCGPQSFILSHHHRDHFRGLFSASRVFRWNGQFELSNVYYPRFPEFTGKARFATALFAINARIALHETGYPDYDFLAALKRLSKLPMAHRPVSRGDIIHVNGEVIDVLWPPRDFSDDSRTLVRVRDAIRNFDVALEEDELTRRIFEHVREGGLFETVSDEGNIAGLEQKVVDQIEIEERRGGLPDSVEKANKSLQAAANDMSLALKVGNDFLFLGDLESSQLRVVSHNLVAGLDLNFRVLVSAHHGTHWHNRQYVLRCATCLSSNGPTLASGFKVGYKKISQTSLGTHVNGHLSVYL